MSRKNHRSTRRLVALALFAALAFVCTSLLHIKVAFLTFDAKDAVMAVAGMFFGPVSAAILSFLVPTLELITLGGDTGLYGFIMNIASSAAFSITAAWIYKYRKTPGGALFALFAAVVSMTAFMMAMNLLVTPHFMGVTLDAVIELIPTLLNAALVLVLYKPIATALRRTRMVESATIGAPYSFNLRTLTMLLVGVVLLVISILLFVFVLKGQFVLWE